MNPLKPNPKTLLVYLVTGMIAIETFVVVPVVTNYKGLIFFQLSNYLTVLIDGRNKD